MHIYSKHVLPIVLHSKKFFANILWVLLHAKHKDASVNMMNLFTVCSYYIHSWIVIRSVKYR